MENINNLQQSENPFTINDEVKGYLIETSKWSKFLAIVGYIGMGLLLLVGLFFIFGIPHFNSITPSYFPIKIMGFVYIVISVLYYFPLQYLTRFSNLIKQGFLINNHQSITSGFEYLKSFSKFVGILTIVVLSIYVLIIFVAIPIALIATKGQLF